MCFLWFLEGSRPAFGRLFDGCWMVVVCFGMVLCRFFDGLGDVLLDGCCMVFRLFWIVVGWCSDGLCDGFFNYVWMWLELLLGGVWMVLE